MPLTFCDSIGRKDPNNYTLYRVGSAKNLECDDHFYLIFRNWVFIPLICIFLLFPIFILGVLFYGNRKHILETDKFKIFYGYIY